jgi:hypothetical protein
MENFSDSLYAINMAISMEPDNQFLHKEKERISEMSKEPMIGIDTPARKVVTERASTNASTNLSDVPGDVSDEIEVTDEETLDPSELYEASVVDTIRGSKLIQGAIAAGLAVGVFSAGYLLFRRLSQSRNEQ